MTESAAAHPNAGAAPTQPTSTPANSDLALNKAASASGYTQTYVAANAVDGDTGTYWESMDNAFPQYFQVDLGSTQAVGRLVLDLPPALVERAMPFVTVFSGRREVDVLDAAPEVVASLPEMTPALLETFLKQRARLPRDIKSIANVLGPAQAGATVEGSDAVRVRTTIAFDNGRQAATEAVILLDAGDDPYRILSWRDDAEITAVRGQHGKIL